MVYAKNISALQGLNSQAIFKLKKMPQELLTKAYLLTTQVDKRRESICDRVLALTRC